MVSVSKGDYVICVGDNGKKILILVDELSQGDVSGLQEKERPSKVRATFNQKKVVCNLGPKPNNGVSYGVKVEPFRKTVKHKVFGDIHVFRTLTTDLSASLSRGFQEASLWLREKRLLTLVEGVETHIRPNYNKVLGMWQNVKSEDKPSLLILSPEDSCEDIMPIITHELGHCIWSNYLTDELKAEWIDLYHDLVDTTDVTKQELEDLRDEFIKSKSTLRKFIRTFDGPAKDIMLAVTSIMRNNQQLNVTHIEMLTSYGRDICDFWPTDPFKLANLKDTITEYAKKSPEELFSEAVSLSSTGVELPKVMRPLLHDILEHCKLSG